MTKKHFEKEKNFVSIVVYMKDAGLIIKDFLMNVDKVMSENFQAYEYVLVDDCSRDDTIKVIKGMESSVEGNLSIIKMAYHHGLEKSMVAGVDLAIGDFVFEFDTTIMNYNAQLIYDLYQTSLQGYDVVVATDKENVKKSSKYFYKFLNRVSYKKMELTTETFRVVSRRAINRVSKNKSRIEYRKALYHYSGFETKIVQYEPINDEVINNKLGLRERGSLALDVLINHSNIGIRIAGIASVLFLVFAIMTTLYTIYSYLTLDSIQSGWSTTMFFLSISFAGVFFILFIISKYLTNILIEVKEQPLYIFKSVEKISK